MAIPDLRAASFRGVPFVVQGGSAKFGRRVVIRQFPQRDTPAAEDLGRDAREFVVQGFVIGDDWKDRRDRLIVAVEKPGKGLLVHPTFGELEVSIPTDGFEVTEDVSELRMSAFRLTCVEAGELVFPTGAPSGLGLINAAVSAMNSTALDDFVAAFSVLEGGFIAAEALADVSAALDALADAIRAPLVVFDVASAVLDEIEGIADAAATLIALPDEFAAAVQAVMDKIDNLAAILGFADRDDGPNGPPVPGAGSTADERTVATNARAVRDLFKRTACAKLADVSGDVEFGSHDEAVAFRGTVADLYTDEAEIGAVSGAAFVALSDLRTHVAAHVTAKAADLARLIVYVPVGIETSLTLAAELYDDASRAREIEDRNATHAVIADPVLVLNV